MTIIEMQQDKFSIKMIMFPQKILNFEKSKVRSLETLLPLNPSVLPCGSFLSLALSS